MKSNQPKIKYFDLYGLRKEKYEFLESHNVKNTKWKDLELKKPHFWFVPKESKGEEKYQKFISLKDIFEKFGSGVITRRDEFAVANSKEELKRRIRIFLDKSFSKEMIANSFKIDDTYEWDLEQARNILRKDKNLDEKYFEYLYRSFDKRWIIYHENLISRPSVLLRQCFPNYDNLGLICSRKIPINTNFNHVFISNLLADIHSASDQSYVFPLYLYESEEKASQKSLLNINESSNKKSNIKVEIIQKLSEFYKKKITSEEIFYYIYAVLYSNIYRKKYQEFLKIDFPRVPFTKNAKIFSKMSEFGKELAGLHLLKSERLENPSASFPISGNSRVEKREYREKEKRVYINDKQYFKGVEPEIWNYCVGGYQVLGKWLKDRINGSLLAEDVEHYLKIITALKHTIEIQKQIDKIYPEIDRGTI